MFDKSGIGLSENLSRDGEVFHKTVTINVMRIITKFAVKICSRFSDTVSYTRDHIFGFLRTSDRGLLRVQ